MRLAIKTNGGSFGGKTAKTGLNNKSSKQNTFYGPIRNYKERGKITFTL